MQNINSLIRLSPTHILTTHTFQMLASICITILEIRTCMYCVLSLIRSLNVLMRNCSTFFTELKVKPKLDTCTKH